MPIPDFEMLLLPVLKLAANGETSASEVEEKIVAKFGITPEEREMKTPSGTRRLRTRLGWVKTFLAKAKLLDTPKWGKFAISETGREVLANPPEKITEGSYRAAC